MSNAVPTNPCDLSPSAHKAWNKTSGSLNTFLKISSPVLQITQTSNWSYGPKFPAAKDLLLAPRNQITYSQ
jgi:hypothetical protein